MLKVNGLNAGYGVSQVLHDVSITVSSGEVLAICGPNGAGKSTLLRSIARVIPSTSQEMTLDGKSITRCSTAEVVRRGIALCPEGRCVFPRMTTEQNLQIGAYTRRDRAKVQQEVDAYFDLWPVIARRRSNPAGMLSGGEQQIVAIGRALMSAPSVLLLDEPSLGLAPVLVDQVYTGLSQLVSGRDMSVLLVEQNVVKAMSLSDRIAVLSAGRVSFESTVSDTDADTVGQHYFHSRVGGAADHADSPEKRAQER